MRCSAALRPPRPLRLLTAFAFACPASCLISVGVGSSRRAARTRPIDAAERAFVDAALTEGGLAPAGRGR
jgi:hypothetical protein